MGTQLMDDERTHVLPDPSTEFGRRVRDRLRDEPVVWLATVTAGGTPQPNPVWFLWQPDSGDPWGDGSFLIYHLRNAARLESLAARPHVSLHFNSTPDGGDIVVFTGEVELLAGHPLAHEVPDYAQKYTAAVGRITGGTKSVEEFMADYPVPSRVRPKRVRGF